MKILKVEQNSEAWFDFRRGKIGGSKAKGVKPLKTGRNKGLVDSAVGYWKILAERVSIAKDGEPEMERGHRLEPIGNAKTNKKFKLDLVWRTDEHLELPGIWVSDESEYIYISPDSAERGNKPTYANETKAFDTDKHLRIMRGDMIAKLQPSYNPLDSLPDDECKDQAVHYFVVNKKMKTLYWTLINDMVAFKNLEHYVIIIKREDVQDKIDAMEEIQSNVLKEIELTLKHIEEWK